MPRSMKTQLLHNICRINGQPGRGIGKTVIAPVDKSSQLVGLSVPVRKINK